MATPISSSDPWDLAATQEGVGTSVFGSSKDQVTDDPWDLAISTEAPQQQQEVAPTNDREQELAASPIGSMLRSQTPGVASVAAPISDVLAQAVVTPASVLAVTGSFMTNLPNIMTNLERKMHTGLTPLITGKPVEEADLPKYLQKQKEVNLLTHADVKKTIGESMGISTIEAQTPAGRIMESGADEYSNAVMLTGNPVAAAPFLMTGIIAQGMEESGVPKKYTDYIRVLGPLIPHLWNGVKSFGKRLLEPWNKETIDRVKVLNAWDAEQQEIYQVAEKGILGQGQQAEEAWLLGEVEVAKSGQVEAERSLAGRTKRLKSSRDEAAAAQKALVSSEADAVERAAKKAQEESVYLKESWSGAEALENLHENHKGLLLDAVNPLDMSAGEVGQIVKKELNILEERARGEASVRFQSFYSKYGSIKARSGGIKTTLETLLEKLTKGGPSLKGDHPVIQQLTKALESIESQGQYMTIQDMMEQKKNIWETVAHSELDPSQRKAVQGYVEKAWGSYDQAVRKELGKGMSFGKPVSKQGLRDYVESNRGWQKYLENWSNPHVVKARGLPVGGTMNYHEADVFAGLNPVLGDTRSLVERKAIEGMTSDVKRETLRDTRQIRRMMRRESDEVATEIIQANTPGAGSGIVAAKDREIVSDVSRSLIRNERPTYTLGLMKTKDGYQDVRRALLSSHENGKDAMDYLHSMAKQDILTEMSNNKGILDPLKIADYVENKTNRFLWNTVVPKEERQLYEMIARDHKGITKHVDNIIKGVESAEKKVVSAAKATTSAEAEVDQFYRARTKEIEKLEAKQAKEMSRGEAGRTRRLKAEEAKSMPNPAESMKNFMTILGVHQYMPKLTLPVAVIANYRKISPAVAAATTDFFKSLSAGNSGEAIKRYMILESILATENPDSHKNNK